MELGHPGHKEKSLARELKIIKFGYFLRKHVTEKYIIPQIIYRRRKMAINREKFYAELLILREYI